MPKRKPLHGCCATSTATSRRFTGQRYHCCQGGVLKARVLGGRIEANGPEGLKIFSAEYALRIRQSTTKVTTNLTTATAKRYQGTMLLSTSCMPATASQQIAWSSNTPKIAIVKGAW